MIDAAEDPEGYARYLKEREKKRKLERQQQRWEEDKQARLKNVKLSGSTEFKVGLKVTICGLQKNPEKNGALGTLLSYIASKERWAVEFHDGSTNNFKVDNLQLVEDNASSSAIQEDTCDIPTAKVYLNNLSAQTTEDDLIGLFGKVGMLAKQPVRDAKGNSKGYQDEWPFAVKLYKPGKEGGDACVEFVERVAAKAAIKAYNGLTFMGSTLSVEYAGGDAERFAARAKEKQTLEEGEKARLAELEKLQKKMQDEKVPAELVGVFARDRC